MILDFPSPVSTGTVFTAQNGVRYSYDGVKWTTVGSPGGGTALGDRLTTGSYSVVLGDNGKLTLPQGGAFTSPNYGFSFNKNSGKTGAPDLGTDVTFETENLSSDILDSQVFMGSGYGEFRSIYNKVGPTESGLVYAGVEGFNYAQYGNVNFAGMVSQTPNIDSMYSVGVNQSGQITIGFTQNGQTQQSTDWSVVVGSLNPDMTVNGLFADTTKTVISGRHGIELNTDRGTIHFGNHPEIGAATHFHIMRDDPDHVDLFFGDDYNFVKLPRTGGVEVQAFSVPVVPASSTWYNIFGEITNSTATNWTTDGSVTYDADGNVYVLGSTTDDSNFDNSTNLFLKYSPVGELLWRRTWTTPTGMNCGSYNASMRFQAATTGTTATIVWASNGTPSGLNTYTSYVGTMDLDGNIVDTHGNARSPLAIPNYRITDILPIGSEDLAYISGIYYDSTNYYPSIAGVDFANTSDTINFAFAPADLYPTLPNYFKSIGNVGPTVYAAGAYSSTDYSGRSQKAILGIIVALDTSTHALFQIGDNYHNYSLWFEDAATDPDGNLYGVMNTDNYDYDTNTSLGNVYTVIASTSGAGFATIDRWQKKISLSSIDIHGTGLVWHNGYIYVSAYTLNGGGGDTDIVVLKLNAATGAVVWSRTIGSPSYDALTWSGSYHSSSDLSIDPTGTYLAYTGSTHDLTTGTANLNNFTLQYPLDGSLLGTYNDFLITDTAGVTVADHDFTVLDITSSTVVTVTTLEVSTATLTASSVALDSGWTNFYWPLDGGTGGYVGLITTATSAAWTFGADGRLTLPNGASIGSSGSLSGIPMTTDRGTVLFGNSPECLPTLLTHFHIMKEDASAVDLFLGDDLNYVKLPGSGETTYGVEIGTYDLSTGTSVQQVWRFGTDGQLTLPETNKITAAATPVAGWIASGVEAYTTDLGSNTYRWNGYPTNFMSVIYSHSTYVNGVVFYPVGNPGAAVSVTGHSGNPGLWEITFSGPLGAGPFVVHSANYAPTHDNPIVVQSSSSTWTFGTDGNLTFPNGDLTIGSHQGAPAIIGAAGKNISMLASGVGDGYEVGSSIGWVDSITEPTKIAAVTANNPLYVGAGDVGIVTGDYFYHGTTNVWNFGADGSITFPDNSVQTTAYVTGNPLIWAATDNGQGSFTQAVAYDSQGNSYSLIAQDNIDHSGVFPATIVKRSSTGSELWKIDLGTNHSVNPWSLVCDGDDNLYVIVQRLNGSVYNNVVLKLNGINGSILWQVDIQDSQNANNMQAVPLTYGLTGNTVIIAGTAYNGNDRDFFVAGISSTGTALTSFTFGDQWNQEAYGMAVNNTTGDLVLAGRKKSNTDNAYYLEMVKFGFSTGVVWQKSLTIDGNYDVQGTDVCLLPDGNWAVLATHHLANGNYGVITMKINNTNGSVVWSREISQGCTNISSSIATDSAGNIYMSAMTYSGNNTPSGGVPIINRLIGAYDTNGNALWQKYFRTFDTSEVLVDPNWWNNIGSTGKQLAVYNDRLLVATSVVTLGQSGPTGASAVVVQLTTQGENETIGAYETRNSYLTDSAVSLTVADTVFALTTSTQTLSTGTSVSTASSTLTFSLDHTGAYVSQLKNGGKTVTLETNGTLLDGNGRNVTGEFDGVTDSGNNFNNQTIGIKNASGYKRLVGLTNSAQTWFDINTVATQLGVNPAWIMGLTIEYQAQSTSFSGGSNASMTGQIIIASSNSSGRDISVTHSEAVCLTGNNTVPVFSKLNMWQANGWALQAIRTDSNSQQLDIIWTAKVFINASEDYC